MSLYLIFDFFVMNPKAFEWKYINTISQEQDVLYLLIHKNLQQQNFSWKGINFIYMKYELEKKEQYVFTCQYSVFWDDDYDYEFFLEIYHILRL